MDESKAIKPTESELEILQVLWERGNATVREVHETLLIVKDVGYTTTLKLMQIMNEKGLVFRNDSSRTHIYHAAVEKEITQNFMLNKFITNLFGGSSSQLVMQALGSSRVTPQELDEIQSMIDQLKKQE